MLAARAVDDGLICGITMQLPNGGPMTVASSDARAAQVDEVQYELDDGPCLRSMRTGQQVSEPDTFGSQRFSGFSQGRPPRAESGRVCQCRCGRLASRGP